MQESGYVEGPGFLAGAGVAGALAILLGVVVLGAGLVVAVRGGPRRHALAVFAGAWIVLPVALFGRAAGEVLALQDIVRLGAAVTPPDLAAGLSGASAVTACAFVGLFLGLVGSVAALARSREDVAPGA